MLTYSSITDAWDPKKKKKENIKNNQVILDNEPTQHEHKVKDPLVLRIYDESVLEKLSIYKEDYKIQLLNSIISDHFNGVKEVNNNGVSHQLLRMEELLEKQNVTRKPSNPEQNIVSYEKEDFKDIIIFLTIGIIILLSMEFIKKNFKVLAP